MGLGYNKGQVDTLLAGKANVGATGTITPDAALHGLLGISATPTNASGTLSPVIGRTLYVKVPIPGGSVINNVVADIATGGAGATVYLGVYNVAGTMLAQTADFGASTTATANITTPLTAAATVPSADSFVYVGLLVSAATTVPVFRGAANGMAQTATNFALTGAGLGFRAFYTVASAQTVLPATVTPSAGTFSGGIYLLGLK